MAGCVDNNTTEDDAYPDFSDTFAMFSYNTLNGIAVSALIRLNDPDQPHLGLPTHPPTLPMSLEPLFKFGPGFHFPG